MASERWWWWRDSPEQMIPLAQIVQQEQLLSITKEIAFGVFNKCRRIGDSDFRTVRESKRGRECHFD